MSARRPAESPPAEEMEVQVKDRLPPVGTGVGHQPVAPLVEAEVGRDLGREGQQLAEYRLTVGALGVPGRREVAGRDDEDVGRGLGREVVEGHRVGAAPDDLRGNLARDDLAEDAVNGHESLAVWPATPRS